MSDDKLDAATDAVKANAEEAHIYHRGATLGALADCSAALKRIANRASVPAGLDRAEIVRSDGPTLEFSGKRIANAEYETKGHDALRIELEIWESTAGALVAVSTTNPAGGHGREVVRAVVVPPQDDAAAMRFAVMDFFEWRDRARSMVRKTLGWELRIEVE